MIPKVVRNFANVSSVVRKERLKVPYQIYVRNSHKTIRELLGQDILINNITVNDIVTDDECYIIDVEYINIKFNPFEIIFVDTSSLKPILPNSTIYGTQIKECNVCIKISSLQEYPTKIPIRINPMLNNNNSADGQLPESFSYFGKIIRKPMNNLCTPLKHPGHQLTPFKIPTIPKLYGEGYKLKHEISMDETKEAYKSEIVNFQQLKGIDNVVVAKSFADCKYGTTGYVIDFDLLPKDRNLNGIIMIQANRICNMVLYFPTIQYTIFEEELESIKSFLEMDEVNAKNFDFVMGK